MKKRLIIIWVIYLTTLLFFLLPYKIPESTKGTYGLTRLLVRDLDAYNAQYTVIQGEEEIVEVFAHEEIPVETDKLVLTGDTPNKKLSREDLLNTDIILHGSVLGKKELAPGSGYVVEYHVESWRLVTYMPMILGMQGDFFIFLFLAEIVMLPVMAVGTVIFLLRRLSR